MSNKKITLSIIIPAYNEEKNYRNGTLSGLFDFLEKQDFSWELLFVNDESTDNTLQLLKKLLPTHPGMKIMSISHGGKSEAVKAGIMAARGEFCLFSDFDQSTPISEVTKVLQAFRQGADVVIAHRKTTYDWPLPQRIRSKIFNILVQLFVLPGIVDTQCGFKAFRTPLAQKLFQELVVTKKAEKGRYMGAFDVELLYLAKKSGYIVKSVDVIWYCVRAGSLSAAEPFKMLLNIITIRIFDLSGKYKKIYKN